MPKITINDSEMEVPEGITLIQAAEMAGIEIPHYCYHPDLPVDGNCRMCLVEIEKIPKLTPSCTTIVAEGMVVRTNTDRVKEGVRGVLEFLLINHPVDCPVCDQAGECRLQDYYMVYGLHTSQIPLDMKVRKRKVVDLGPLVVLDKERCVLCSRCVRFCDTVAGTGELQFFGRGDHVEIGTLDDRPLESPYSGNVVDICPVGALTSRDFRFKCRVWFLHSTDSICGGCSTGCNLRIDHRDGTVFRLIPRRNVEVNKSWLCDEGRSSFHELEGGERLTLATAKGRDGMHAPVSWSETAESIHSRLEEIKSAHGPDSILGFASPSATNEALFLFRRYLKDCIGSNRLEFRLDSEDRKVVQPEDDILRFVDKHPNSMGAMKLGFMGELSGIEGAIEAARAGSIRAALVIYLKPLVRRPSDQEVEQRLVELLRALDYSVLLAAHKAEWQSAASLVAPVAAWSEEEGTYTNRQGRIQAAGQAVRPPGEAVQLWAALSALLAAAGAPIPTSPRDVFNDLAEQAPEFRGLDYNEVKKLGALPGS